MNILYFTQLFYPAIYGGGEYLFYMLTKKLAGRGHKIYVISQKLVNTDKIEFYEGIKIHRVGADFSFSGTLPPTIRYHLGYLVGSFRAGRNIIQKSKDQGSKIDLIHSNTYVPALSAQACSKLFNIPHVVTFHDVCQAQNSQFWKQWMAASGDNIPFYAGTAAKMLEKIILRMNLNGIHTVSDMSKADLLKFGTKEDKIHVIPNGIDISNYAMEVQTIESNPPNAVFMGRLVFYKNVEILIKAFIKVVDVFPKSKLIIIGEGPHKHKLVEKAASIKSNVIFTGWIPHEQKVSFIKNSSLVAFPSLVEGFGIAVIEGFACKKPVLVSDVRPLSDIVTNDVNGYVLPPYDSEAWADKIILLFQDRDKRRILGSNAYSEWLKKYELDSVVSKVEGLYTGLVQQKTN